MIIKESPQDFVVNEIPDFILKDSGDYSIYKLFKINLNTEQAIDIICSRFHIERKNIKYAGSKDKNAVTTQYISVYKNNRLSINEKLSQANNIDIKLSFIGYLDVPLSLGSLEGNDFEIIVKDLDNKNIDSFIKRTSNNAIDQIPNYFDDQRFSLNNKNIGLCILKKDFKTAIKLICEGNGRYENIIKEHIINYPNDYVGALKTMPKKILMMYLHSVQSYIFNETLSENLKKYAIENSVDDNKINFFTVKYAEGELIFFENSENNCTGKNDCTDNGTSNNKTLYPMIDDIELVGFDSKLANDVTSKILRVLGLTQRDFIIRAIPDLSAEGSIRKSIVAIKDFSYEKIDEKIIKVKFKLQKGSYATIVIKQLFCSG